MLTNKKMMKFLSVLLALTMVLSLAACTNGGSENRTGPPPSSGDNSANNSLSQTDSNTSPPESEETGIPDTQPGENKEVRIKITVGDQELTATLLDNSTAKALIEQLPLTIPMEDLYSREMCYHFPEELPANEAQTTGYEVGEIIYWPPRHSLVIMYAQNEERFNMQKIGCIDSGVEIFEETGDVEVTFELLDK